MARTKRDRAAKKCAQEALSGGAVAQLARCGGQGRAPAPQDDENGGLPHVNIMNAQMADLLAQLYQNSRIAAALADA